MAGPVTRAQLHARLCEALEQMPTTWQDVDLRHADDDAWHVVLDSVGGLGVELAPMHGAHLALSVEWTRARRSDEAQKRGRDALATIDCTVFFQFEYRPGHELEDYRAALVAADLVASTLEGPWHAGAALVDVDVDWDPRWVEGEPIIISPVTLTIRHERVI